MAGNVAKFVAFGRGGDSVEYGGGSRGSGYGSPEQPHAADPRTCVIPDGTIALDKRPALETDEGVAWVFRGPMVNVDLPDGEHVACPIPSAPMLLGLEGSFGAMAATHAAHKLAERPGRGPLDYVSVAEYVAGWKQLGARVGRYEGGAIVWE